MRTEKMLNRVTRLAAAASLSGALVALGAGPALADTKASCVLDQHVTIVPGEPGRGEVEMTTGEGTADCRGYLADLLVRPGGASSMNLTLPTFGLTTGGGCRVGAATGNLTADIPRMISVIGPDRFVGVAARLKLQRVANVIGVTGTGTAEDQPISVTGVAQFVPDGGQGCAGASSGRLVEWLVMTSGSGQSSDATAGRTGSSEAPSHAAATRERPGARRPHRHRRHHTRGRRSRAHHG